MQIVHYWVVTYAVHKPYKKEKDIYWFVIGCQCWWLFSVSANRLQSSCGSLVVCPSPSLCTTKQRNPPTIHLATTPKSQPCLFCYLILIHLLLYVHLVTCYVLQHFNTFTIYWIWRKAYILSVDFLSHVFQMCFFGFWFLFRMTNSCHSQLIGWLSTPPRCFYFTLIDSVFMEFNICRCLVLHWHPQLFTFIDSRKKQQEMMHFSILLNFYISKNFQIGYFICGSFTLFLFSHHLWSFESKSKTNKFVTTMW